jgi:hypothetical protein
MSKQSVSKIGRPTKLNEKTVSLIESCIQNGWSISQTCYTAKISRETFYEWYRENEEFSDRINEAPNNLVQVAKKNILRAVVEGDIKTSIWVIEKYSTGGFSAFSGGDIPKNEIEVEDEALETILKIQRFEIEQAFLGKKDKILRDKDLKENGPKEFSVRQGSRPPELNIDRAIFKDIGKFSYKEMNARLLKNEQVRNSPQE